MGMHVRSTFVPVLRSTCPLAPACSMGQPGSFSQSSHWQCDVQQCEGALIHCRYCGIHSASCVVKCVKSGKWFCNGRVTGTASCILTHLVSHTSLGGPCNSC